MSFTQETLVNTNRCDGCEKHCKLYYVTVEKAGIIHAFYPTIGGKKIKTYINENGFKTDAIKYNIGFDNETDHIEEVIIKAREIARLCDHYKTR